MKKQNNRYSQELIHAARVLIGTKKANVLILMSMIDEIYRRHPNIAFLYVSPMIQQLRIDFDITEREYKQLYAYNIRKQSELRHETV